jgi:hypothetical protein
MALVVIPADSLVSGTCWFRTTVKPGILTKSVLAGGATSTVYVWPPTVSTRSSIVVEPVAEGVASTEDVELIVVAVRLRSESKLMETLLRVDVAVPIPEVALPFAVSSSRSAVTWIGPMEVSTEASWF